MVSVALVPLAASLGFSVALHPGLGLDAVALTTATAPVEVSESAWDQIRDAHEASERMLRLDEGAYAAWNRGQGWTARFDGRGVELASDGDGWRWGFELSRWGREGEAQPVEGCARVEAAGTRIRYLRDGAPVEWFVNDRRGLEHGFTVESRPEGSGSLVFDLALRAGWCAELDGDPGRARFVDASGATELTYGGLTAFDATGRTLPAWMESTGEELRLRVDDRGAIYPLTVDPIVQQAYLKASNTGWGDEFGFSIAVSGDTVVVGAPYEDSAATGVDGNQASNAAVDSGAAYVFVRNGSTWTQQAYLKASNTGAGDLFGAAVAISGDTIVVSAEYEDSAANGVDGDQSSDAASGAGAAYVFVRTGSTWSQQAYLKASNTGAGDLFASVAVSGDTLVVGAPYEDSAAMGVDGDQSSDAMPGSGACYVFVRRDGAWSQQAYLKASNTGTYDRFGWSVGVSGDTVVVGALTESSAATGVDGDQWNDAAGWAGAAYVFGRRGSTWTQEAYLKASNTDPGDEFGVSVGIAGDTVVVGAVYEDSAATGVDGDQSSDALTQSGATYVFVRGARGWAHQAYLKASNTGGGDGFGEAVAIAGDRILVGARWEKSAATGVDGDQSSDAAAFAGAAYLFARRGATWTQEAYLKASNTGPGDHFGSAVAIDGDTLAISAPWEASGATGVDGDQTNNNFLLAGAAYLFSRPTALLGDLDGDGTVGAADLATLLGAWGACGTRCASDLDADGSVGVADLAILLAAWTG